MTELCYCGGDPENGFHRGPNALGDAIFDCWDGPVPADVMVVDILIGDVRKMTIPELSTVVGLALRLDEYGLEAIEEELCDGPAGLDFCSEAGFGLDDGAAAMFFDAAAMVIALGLAATCPMPWAITNIRPAVAVRDEDDIWVVRTGEVPS